jgi:hypothetical protein
MGVTDPFLIFTAVGSCFFEATEASEARQGAPEAPEHFPGWVLSVTIVPHVFSPPSSRSSVPAQGIGNAPASVRQSIAIGGDLPEVDPDVVTLCD